MIGVERVTHWMRSRRALKRHFNPYIVGTPVFDRHLFFGREAVARLTLERLTSKSIQLTCAMIATTTNVARIDIGVNARAMYDASSHSTSGWKRYMP